MIKNLLTAAAALAAFALRAKAEMPEQLNFGIISTESSSALQSSFQPFLDDMAEALGVTV